MPAGRPLSIDVSRTPSPPRARAARLKRSKASHESYKGDGAELPLDGSRAREERPSNEAAPIEEWKTNGAEHKAHGELKSPFLENGMGPVTRQVMERRIQSAQLELDVAVEEMSKLTTKYDAKLREQKVRPTASSRRNKLIEPPDRPHARSWSLPRPLPSACSALFVPGRQRCTPASPPCPPHTPPTPRNRFRQGLLQ